MFRYATATPFAVLTSKWPSDHARYTEILVIELPQAQQLVNDCFLLGTASKLWYVARVFDHAVCVEICTKSVTDQEKQIIGGMR